MSALEDEVLEKFQQLDKAAQQRVREKILRVIDSTEDIEPSAFDYDAWFRDVEALRQEIHTRRSDALQGVDVVGILRDIRDGEDE